MKILHITDSHGTAKGPESRKDVYYIAFLRKLYEIGKICKLEHIDMVIHTGDLFHTARVSDKFTGQTAELIKAMGVPFYVVPGNHDIEGYTTDTIDQTKLGLLAKTGVISILDRDNPIRIVQNQGRKNEYTVAISGQEYYAHIDEGNMKDFEMQQDEADLNILAIHGYLANTPQHPDVKCTMCQDVVSDADIILTGHYHRQFEWSDGQNLDIFNPGSMMRVEQTEYNRTHMPQYGILDISIDRNDRIEWDYTFHTFRVAQPGETIFDYTSKYQSKQASITLDGFKNSLANTMSQVNTNSNNIVSILNSICTNMQLDAALEQKVIAMYNNTLQNIPDEFEAPNGYIENNYRKKITKVVIHNFQSHSDTTVEFNDGLNIIVGESNNGKTAVLRAMMWVIDNNPLGTDFIMAGENDCFVRIEYDDGTYVERGRTLKDTGYYKVKFINCNGHLEEQEYRGFTNAVPIEVANVHQMPKVNITKDIETHLNVLSQLDAPFLLTESPLVKASAIGRITGTHVLDTGVKESNKTIQSNKKAIKIYNDSIVDQQDALKKLPDVETIKNTSELYERIIKAVEKREDRISIINTKLNQYKLCATQILDAQSTLVEAKQFVKIKPALDRAENSYKTYVFGTAKLTVHEQLCNNITDTNAFVDISSKFAQFMPYIMGIHSKVVACETTKSKYDTVNKIQRDIVNANDSISNVSAFANLAKNILTYCTLKESLVNKMQEKYDNTLATTININAVEKDITAYKKLMKVVKANIKNVTKEQTMFVIDNGICPCCGQTVTDENHANAIITFFEQTE